MATRRKNANIRNRFFRPTLSVERLEAREMMAADVVIDWNNATIAALRSNQATANPGDGSRIFALVHTAIYDAVNAITKEYSSFALTAEAPSWASKEAAAATAARDVLASLFPQLTPNINSLWQQNLAAIPDGPAENEGVKIGHQAATTILNLRADDGSKGGSDYVFTDAPGHWDVDPLHPDQVAWGPNWGEVSPFAIREASDFGAPPPPALGSAEYAAAYNEVKSLGALNSTTRTADQTEIAIFWAYDRPLFGPPTILFNQAVQTIADLKGNSLGDNARLFAMVNVAMADAGVATWKVKFDYDFWRPITAIREGDTDGNPATVADPNWVPLGAPGPNPNSTADDFTPPFPAYTSGHAAFGAATFRTLANFYGSDQFNFSLTSEELPGVVRHYSSFSQAALENGRSRIYMGVHWEFDNVYSQIIGNGIADYVTQNLFQERGNSVLVMLQRHDAGYRTVTLPAGTPIDIKAEGNVLKIVNHKTGVALFEELMSDIASIRIDQRNEATDFTRVIVSTGTVMPQTIVFEIVGDEDWFDGAGITTGDGDDLIVIRGDMMRAVNVTPFIHLYGIGYIDIGTHGGNDVLAVHGEQHGRQIDLSGYEGNDWYEIGSTGAKLFVSDTDGNDYFNFSLASSFVNINLANNNGQQQPAGAGNILRFWGDIENAKGTKFNDVLFGTTGNNMLWGLEGDDNIQGGLGNDTLYGGAGNDRIHAGPGNDLAYGEAGNDIIIGGDGDDKLWGGNGVDLIIAGRGQDLIYGEAGDDLLLGGTTAYDANWAALQAILAEWTSSKTRNVRRTNIQNSYLYASAVIDDGHKDTFVRGADDAWCLNQGSDVVQ